MPSNEVFRSKVRSARIFVFMLLMILAAVGIVRSLTHVSATARGNSEAIFELRKGSRLNFGAIDPIKVLSGKPEKGSPQNQQKPQKADDSQAVEQRGGTNRSRRAS